MSSVKIVECPRESWQGLPKLAPTQAKAQYLRALVDTGFMHIDAVSERAVPQMRDAELVLDYLDPPDDVEILGLAVNAQGAERAVKTGAVATLAFPYSISPAFLDRNQRQTPEEALEQLEMIGEQAYKAGLDVAAYVSMAFGNPFGDAWDIDEVVSAVDLLVDAGVEQVTLADTAGMASAGLIGDVLRCVLDVHSSVEIGLHLHTARDEAAGKVRAAYDAGCRRFHAAIGGWSSSPFVVEGPAGIVPTEVLLATLRELGAELPDLRPLDGLLSAGAEIARRSSETGHDWQQEPGRLKG